MRAGDEKQLIDLEWPNINTSSITMIASTYMDFTEFVLVISASPAIRSGSGPRLEEINGSLGSKSQFVYSCSTLPPSLATPFNLRLGGAG